MAILEAERIGEVLWVTGNVMPSEEKALQQAVQDLVDHVKTPGRALDMSGVRYISSSAAKALLSVAQEAKESGGKLKVRSSIPVVRTLSLLGAEAWMDIEPCQKPNPKPASSRPGKDSNLTMAVGGAPQKDSHSRIGLPEGGASAPPAEGSIQAQLADSGMAPRPAGMRSSVGLNQPGSTAVRVPHGASAVEQAAMANAQARAGLPLVAEEIELPEDLSVLKALIVMRTYTFQLPGAKNDITGKVLSRVGGPWIMVDSHGARKMLNVRHVAIVDILA
jgi:anti-anti-sigma factor